MKTIYKYYLMGLCLFVGTLATIAQNEHTEWEAKSYLVSINDYDVEIESNLSKQSSTFTWEQVSNLSTQTRQYSVTALTGTWDAQQNLGTINYTLASADDSATLTVTGTSDEVTIYFTVLDGNGNTYKSYVFTVDTFTNL